MAMNNYTLNIIAYNHQLQNRDHLFIPYVYIVQTKIYSQAPYTEYDFINLVDATCQSFASTTIRRTRQKAIVTPDHF